MSDEEYIAQQLRKAREYNDMTLREAAERIGDVSYRTVHAWEHCGSQPTATKLMHACRAYGITTFDYFIESSGISEMEDMR